MQQHLIEDASKMTAYNLKLWIFIKLLRFEAISRDFWNNSWSNVARFSSQISG
jgi:hypothetical protein